MNSEVMTQPNEEPQLLDELDRDEPDTLGRPRPRFFRIVKRVLLGMVIFVGLLVAYYLLFDRYFRPEVDPNLTNVKVEKIAPLAGDEEKKRGSCTDLFLTEAGTNAENPIEPALAVARDCLKSFRKNVRDYTGVMISQERVRGKLAPEEFYQFKMRNPRKIDGQKHPFSVYLKFLKPRNAAGREVIWVKGWHDGKLIAHEGGLLNVISVRLPPTHKLAMNGKRYPITRIGIENMLRRIVEVAENELEHGEAELVVDRSITLDGHAGTVIKMIHPVRRDHFAYHIAKIFVDDELNMPVGYEGYTWPKSGSDKPILVERYFYSKLQLNVGLTDTDFDPKNEDYDFP